MNNINELELKIYRLNIEKNILFNKNQIDIYKSKLSRYDQNSDYHQYLLKNIEIKLLQIEDSKVKLEEIDTKPEIFIDEFESNVYEYENINKKIEFEIDKIDKKLDKISETLNLIKKGNI